MLEQSFLNFLNVFAQITTQVVLVSKEYEAVLTDDQLLMRDPVVRLMEDSWLEFIFQLENNFLFWWW